MRAGRDYLQFSKLRDHAVKIGLMGTCGLFDGELEGPYLGTLG